MGSCMLNGLLDRTVVEAYGSWEDGLIMEDASESDADIKEQAAVRAQRKVWRMKVVLRDEGGRRALCLIRQALRRMERLRSTAPEHAPPVP